MKTENWNGHEIRLYDFLDQIETISGGKYLDITKTKSTINMEKMPFSTLYECEDGRLLLETTWTEIDGIEVEKPIPVFADVKKAYGIASKEDFNEIVFLELTYDRRINND